MAKISGLGLGQIKKVSGLGLGSIKKVSGLGLGLIWSSFMPSGMVRSGGGTGALTTSYVVVNAFVADTTNYPGSVVTGGTTLVSQGSKTGATVSASLPLTGGYQYSANIQIKVNGTVAVVGAATTTTPATASVVMDIPDGAQITIEAKSTASFTQPNYAASGATVTVT